MSSNGTRNFWVPEGGVLAMSVPTSILYADEEGRLAQRAPIVHEARPMTRTDVDRTSITPVPVGTENGVMTFQQCDDIPFPKRVITNASDV